MLVAVHLPGSADNPEQSLIDTVYLKNSKK
jgi:hypothetical protein